MSPFQRAIPQFQMHFFQGDRLARLLCAIFLLFVSAQDTAAQTSEVKLSEREKYLQELLGFLPPVRTDRGMVTRFDTTWLQWQKRTGELPPDFDRMPSLPFLPDPLVLDQGGRNIPVRTIEQWREKRAWIESQVKYWLSGTFPPAPDNLQAETLSEETSATVTSRTVELRFGPGHKARLTVELLIPQGEGPFPVFLTQWSHRNWALVAVRRGYLACIYAGADEKDDTEGYAEVWYPEYDFTRLMRRAWGAHRAVDYLYSLPIVDREKIAVTGHSRNGKQSILAGAFDPRITAVMPISGGTGAEVPYRYTDDKFANETILEITSNTPNWLHPRLRFFVGREHKLPVDQNLLMALIAPRALLVSSALTEYGGNPWGIEQNFRSLQRVYKFLGAENKLAIDLRYGTHCPSAGDIENNLDFLDYVFGRNSRAPQNTLYYKYTFEGWCKASGEEIDPLAFPEKDLGDLLTDKQGRRFDSLPAWQEKKKDVIGRIKQALGTEPPAALNPGPRRLYSGAEDDWLGMVIGRPEATKTMGRLVVHPYGGSFGDDLFGYLYYPPDENGNLPKNRLPAVIFLHNFAYPTGFSSLTDRFVENLVRQDFVVFAFDMIGFASRIEEGRRFYERYPHWSKMGRMVADVRSAVDMLQNQSFVDPGRIYTLGYSIGGTVALFSAALDERIAGAVTVCGFTPLRPATPDKGLEGVQAYSHLHGLIPRLGFFVGQERRIPFDFHEVLAAIAPRPLLVVAPALDRDACFSDVKACVDEAGKVYRLFGKENSLGFSGPQDYNHFHNNRQQEVLDWLAANRGR